MGESAYPLLPHTWGALAIEHPINKPFAADWLFENTNFISLIVLLQPVVELQKMFAPKDFCRFLALDD